MNSTFPFGTYELLDSGHGQKLEVISGLTVIRPCPQAIWKPKLDQKKWSQATSIAHRTKEGGGKWEHKKPVPENLFLTLTFNSHPLFLQLKFTSFGHCGVFFEQLAVWQWLYDEVRVLKEKLNRPPKVLNLFGYTGAASLVMALAGAEVYHVDSSKGVLSWGQQSQKKSHISDRSLHWVHEDVQEFLKHSFKKNFIYDGVLADPPSWGHGAKKEVWNFEKHIVQLSDLLHLVLDKKNSFIFLTSHTQGVQQEALNNVLAQDSRWRQRGCGELGISHKNDSRILPAGIFAWGKTS